MHSKVYHSLLQHFLYICINSNIYINDEEWCGVNLKFNFYEWDNYSKWLLKTSKSINLNNNNSQTNYLYMEIFNGDDSNEAISGFWRVWFWKVMMSFTKLMIKNEGPDQDLLRFIYHTDTLILWILPDIETK